MVVWIAPDNCYVTIYQTIPLLLNTRTLRNQTFSKMVRALAGPECCSFRLWVSTITMMRMCYIWWIISWEIHGASCRHGFILLWRRIHLYSTDTASSLVGTSVNHESWTLYQTKTDCGRIFVFYSNHNHPANTFIFFSLSPIFFIPSNINQNRLKEQHLSVSVITNPTRHVVVVVRHPITSKRRHALVVAIPRRRCVTSTGVKKPKVDGLWVLVGWDTWRHWPVGLRMDLGRVHRRRRWLPARIEIDWFSII